MHSIHCRSTARAVALVATLVAANSIAQPVDIEQGTEVGAGYAFRRGDACLVLTALHVVPSEVGEIVVRDISGARNGATRTYGNPTYDLALLELTGARAVACNQTWPDSSWMGALSPNSKTMFEAVRHYASGGRESIIALRYAGRTGDVLTLAPLDRTTIRESDSGTMVRFEDKLAGIVRAVDPKTDRVDVLRMDTIDKLIGERFRGGGRAPLAIEGVYNRQAINANWTAYLRTWVSENTGRPAVTGNDPSAKCRLAVNLMDLKPIQMPNPDYERATSQDCSLMKKLNKKLGDSCEQQKRKAVSTTPRMLAAYQVAADVKVQPPRGPALAKVASGTVPIDGKRATRSMDEQFAALEAVMAPTAKDLIAQAGCD